MYPSILFSINMFSSFFLASSSCFRTSILSLLFVLPINLSKLSIRHVSFTSFFVFFLFFLSVPYLIVSFLILPLISSHKKYLSWH